LATHRWFSTLCGHLLALSLASLSAAAPGAASLVDEFLRAADAGECIESLTYRTIQRQGPAAAAAVVGAALAALAQREQQQRALGCDGDIAAQAIAAGADPDDVLAATAAGL
jgi:hypothetical protein